MKTIHKGVPDADKACEWTCKECKSVIQSSKKEGRFEHDRDGSVIVTKCPECKTDNWIAEDLFR